MTFYKRPFTNFNFNNPYTTTAFGVRPQRSVYPASAASYFKLANAVVVMVAHSG